MTAGSDDAVNRARVTRILVQLICFIFFHRLTQDAWDFRFLRAPGKEVYFSLPQNVRTNLDPGIGCLSVVS